jgi:hypothetical protein
MSGKNVLKINKKANMNFYPTYNLYLCIEFFLINFLVRMASEYFRIIEINSIVLNCNSYTILPTQRLIEGISILLKK